jgi:hypothetical protein
MAGKRFEIRLAVGSPHGPRSSVWLFWSRNSEVYAAHRSMGGIQKFSFHTPTLCRHAFTKEHGTPRGQSSRAVHEWHRGSTPPRGSNHIVRVLRIGVATDHLSTRLAETPPDNTRWINPAPSGGSTMIDLLFTNDSEDSLCEALKSEPANIGHKLLGYSQLQNGEAIAISSWHSVEADTVFRVSAAPHDPRDLLIFPLDPDVTGRPVRLTLFSNPKDRDLMRVWELGGYWHTPLTDAEWDLMCKPYKSKTGTLRCSSPPWARG